MFGVLEEQQEMKVAGIRPRWCRALEAMMKTLTFILRDLGSLRNTPSHF